MPELVNLNVRKLDPETARFIKAEAALRGVPIATVLKDLVEYRKAVEGARFPTEGTRNA